MTRPKATFPVSAFALVCALAGVGCGDAGSDDLGALEAQSGPFDGDIALDSDAPEVGDHDAELRLVDATSQALAGAEVTVVPFMPAHGHGSNVVQATETEPGTYLAEQLSLFMPGVWELRIRVVDGDAEGRLAASFQVR